LRATNLAFCGTFVTEGSAYGIVLAIGIAFKLHTNSPSLIHSLTHALSCIFSHSSFLLFQGRDTLKYRVSKRIQNNDYPWSNIPIFLKMDRLVLILTAIAILLCVLLFTSGLIIARGNN
jgi:magnesium-transporting ATPase (P-type)